MADKFKKVDKEYLLTDSTVNCYGYRLLTSGYQLDEYQRNPIGYYMHDRNGGILVRWEDFRQDGDCVYAKPCVNLSNERGQQTVDEAENGFLNAASVGHIVVLDYSTEPAMMLPDQTGPTVTKWYNRECSLVDIPGNSNALTALFDEGGNTLQLADLMAKPNKDNSNNNNMKEVQLSLSDLAGLQALGLNVTDAASLLLQVKELKATADKVKGLEQTVKDLNANATKKEVAALSAQGIKDKKLTVQLAAKLEADYAENPAGLKNLIDAMPAYQGVTDLIDDNNKAADAKKYDGKSWDDLMEANLLPDLRANHPELYKAIYRKEFKCDPKV